MLVPNDGPAAREFRSLGATVHRVDLRTLRRIGDVRSAAEIACGFDLLYSHTSIPGEILGGRVCRMAGIAHVVHRHTEPHFSPRIAVRIVQRLLYRRQLHTTPFIAVASHVAASLQGLGIPAERITIVSNGVDINAIRERGLSVGPRRGVPVVGVLGRLDPTQKGQDVFVEAIVGQGDVGARFVIGGSPGPFWHEESTLRHAAAEADIPIEDPGSAGIEFLASLDVVVMPSRYEGSPVTMFEAMALGKAIIASGIPGVVEVLEPTGAGIIVPPADPAALADAIASLVGDSGRRQALGQRALEVVRAEHDLAGVLDRIVAVLRLSGPDA